ncbi:MAG: hypothetical protein QNJ54_33695 [Prochloraceae cyanobacterium]|nr:hypothetical protein [Prochloraceae cyanobacterium]
MIVSVAYSNKRSPITIQPYYLASILCSHRSLPLGAALWRCAILAVLGIAALEAEEIGELERAPIY